MTLLVLLFFMCKTLWEKFITTETETEGKISGGPIGAKTSKAHQVEQADTSNVVADTEGVNESKTDGRNNNA
jgi:hypothetical protein